ncbi:hypothetical protein [Streptomyces caatingaensis]|uniref:Uncharacterized protein n=1 Tax=Streptomyces caatingaensis TaxID=1678637 RepID=A0A0K9XA65_9ACTN|nr:hypothetical protein [Streptomyces caatingaensis]KNB50098.1 hypothetical protein AC230_25695 [Streptomyces caatingaensis]
METRSIFTGAVKALEARTETFGITESYARGPFTVRVPEGALILGASQRLGKPTCEDGKAYLDGSTLVTGEPTEDGLGWTVRDLGFKVLTDVPGAAWTVPLTIRVTYAVPA